MGYRPHKLLFIAVCIIVNVKLKAETMIVTRKNLFIFIKEPTALPTVWTPQSSRERVFCNWRGMKFRQTL